MDDDRFIEEHRPLVRSIAHKLRGELALNCELEDLTAYGFRGLLEARSRFDASRNVRFNTFAYYRIRGAILDGVRQMAYLPRRAHARIRAAEATDDVTETLGSARAAAQQRSDPGQALQDLDDALGRITSSFALSVLGQSEQESSSEDSPEHRVITAQQKERVRRMLGGLPDRERALIEGFYFRGRRFDEVARELGISKSWASRLHAKALDMLRQRLDEP